MTVIIGLEIHCQLTTQTKLFCGCSTDYRDDPPNTHTCPICLGLPGSLPSINRRAVEYALRVAKALDCTIPEEAEFSRKNYFYPDLPKGFQITMYDRPLAVDGYLEIEADDGTEKRVRITRVHMEEDPGRLVHVGSGDRPRYSLVDYNRSGIPLIEIVTEPDLRSPREARRFINTLRTTLEYLGVFDGDREGGLRVDANISLEGGNRVEVKNISSYKGVEKALTFEITRQRNLLRRGLSVERETRHFLEARGVTTSARSTASWFETPVQVQGSPFSSRARWQASLAAQARSSSREPRITPWTWEIRRAMPSPMSPVPPTMPTFTFPPGASPWPRGTRRP